MSMLLQDLRQSLRALIRAPGYTLIAVATLALGIGATTAIYTVLEKVALDPLPYPEADRLVRLANLVPGVGEGARWDLSMAQYFFYGEHAGAIEAIGAYRMGGANLDGPDGAVRGLAAEVSAGTLRLLGARTILGRLFEEADDVPGGPDVAVISHGYWQSRFGGDPNVIGKTVRVNELPFEVIGVMGPGVELPGASGLLSGVRADVWVPMKLNPAGPFYNNHVIPMMARLAPGATVEQAQAELDRLRARLPETFPKAYSQAFFDRFGFRTVVQPLKAYVVGDLAKNLWILFGAVGLVLLIAAANVANLFLVRTEGRRRELTIRAALGASRLAIARHYLAESLILALTGGALALLLGFGGVRWLTSIAPDTLPRLDAIRIDGSVLLFALGISIVVACALAATAALRHGDVRGTATLAEGGRTTTVGRERQRVRSTLVASQVALALVLVVGAGLLLESFRRLRAVDPGFDPEGGLKVELFVPNVRYPDSHAKWQFFAQLLERVRTLPGVTAAGISTHVPLTGGYGCTAQTFEDRAVHDRLGEIGWTTCADQVHASPGALEALGIPLRRGRFLTEADHANPSAAAVVVSEAFAERFWPGEDPIGKRIAPSDSPYRPYFEVVGVVGDVYANSVTDEPAIAVYYPMVPPPETPGFWYGGVSLVVRTATSSPIALLPAIRRAVEELDPGIPIANAEELETIVARSMSRLSFTLALIALAAGIALALAAIGLYGVISYIVTRRTGEIGVRIALGAQPRQVERLVVGDALRLVAIGLAVGVAGALVVTRLLRGFLYGVEPTHPLAYLAAATLLAAVATAASWVPARRAAKVDPMMALRVE